MKGKTSLLVLCTSFILYIMDIISDIYVAVQHYRNGEFWWCAFTLAFVIVPHVIINTYAAYININFLWLGPRKSFLMWICQISILASFKQEFTRWRREHWKKSRDARDEQHSADVTLTMHHTFLCLAEAFAESAPQCCLQIYIMMRQWHFPWYTVISTVLSLFSLAWSITSLETSRKTCEWVEKKKYQSFPKRSLVVFLASHLCLLISRLTAIVMFAYVFRYYVFIIIGIHWFLVFSGICFGKKFAHPTRIISFTTNGNKTDIRDRVRLTMILNASLRAYPMLFCFSSSIAKLSFRKKIKEKFKLFTIIFYGIVLLENAIMVFLSTFNGSRKADHVQFLTKIVLPLVFGGFISGMLFLFLYNRCCHPRKYEHDTECTKTNNSNLLGQEVDLDLGKIATVEVEMKHTKYCGIDKAGTCYEDIEHELFN